MCRFWDVVNRIIIETPYLNVGFDSNAVLIHLGFTGVNDSICKPIYSGDILYDGTNYHVVDYFNELASFRVFYGSSQHGPLTQDWVKDFDKIVVGNIFENCCLLGGEFDELKRRICNISVNEIVLFDNERRLGASI